MDTHTIGSASLPELSHSFIFEKQITPLQTQKNGRELEIIVQECIMTTI
jgi:hypothetical protein